MAADALPVTEKGPALTPTLHPAFFIACVAPNSSRGGALTEC